MKEITQQVLSDIEIIKLSLEALSNQGISVIDSFAPITTGINILTTVFATGFGGWITIQLFKRQEKMRINQELCLEFYKEYSSLYLKLHRSIYNLRKTIIQINPGRRNIMGVHCLYDDLNFYIDKENKDYVDLERHISIYKNRIEKYFKIKKESSDLNYLLYTKKNIWGEEDNPYLEVEYKLMKIFVMYNILFINGKELKEILYKYDNKDPDKYKETFKRRIKTYNRMLERLYGSIDELKEILEFIEIENKKVEDRFLGQYFRKNSIIDKLKVSIDNKNV